MRKDNAETLVGPLELWGGLECTVNRVGDDYFSQMARNGHITRIEDLERFATLGIQAIRYPVLWELTAPNGLDTADWSWPDQRLHLLRQLRINPIVGLVHHGSGPRHTCLVDPAFAENLAAFAGAVARRYPWVRDYTPVNEPLTTARFSGLYGVWYPHGRDERTFMRALINQCRAVLLSMRAIRTVNPDARLVQTDDLGKTYSTPLLAYQAEFQNELRWLSWDLLSGRVDRDHYMWGWLTRCCGIPADELLWLLDNAYPPDIVGVNYYITSERWLDERLENYPARYHGGNGRHRYADIEAPRAIETPTIGIGPLLMEAWERYHLPLAVTEAHIDAHREDQMRWLSDIWRAAGQAKEQGADMRAVTVWALLGAYDWNCLVTVCRGYYEPGPFDLRGARPRPTAVAMMMRDLARGAEPAHPVLTSPGWWKRPGRFFCPPVYLAGLRTKSPDDAVLPILITGAAGTLGSAFARLCRQRGLPCREMTRKDMDIADPASVERAIERYQPWAVINAAGYVRVDDAERDAERCFQENTLGPAVLAAVCAKADVQLLTFSTDLVFDGGQQTPYVETDRVAPLNVYGRSKAAAEQRVQDGYPETLIIRTSSFFGPWDDYNFITLALRLLSQGQLFRAAHDITVSPTYVPDLVHACLDLLVDHETGVWHLTNGQPITWAELALRAAERADVDTSRLEACSSNELGYIARRPAYSALGSERAVLLPSLEDALGRYMDKQREKGWLLTS